MTPTEIRVAVAEACRWRRGTHRDLGYSSNSPLWLNPKGDKGCLTDEDLPNYPSDLNACHEMEATLGQWWVSYENELLKVIIDDNPGLCGGEFNDLIRYRVITATAPQRCEAFLRVKGKWKE